MEIRNRTSEHFRAIFSVTFKGRTEEYLFVVVVVVSISLLLLVLTTYCAVGSALYKRSLLSKGRNAKCSFLALLLL